jgi:hypothetical protein
MSEQKIVNVVEGLSEFAVHAQVRVCPGGVVIADIRSAQENRATVNGGDLAVQAVIHLQRSGGAEDIHLHAM